MLICSVVMHADCLNIVRDINTWFIINGPARIDNVSVVPLKAFYILTTIEN